VVCSGLNAAAASTGGGGAGNHGHWDGGSGGSGGDGPSSGPGGRCPDNVLGDIASNESADKLEDVILLDVSGELANMCACFDSSFRGWMRPMLAACPAIAL
jgi:hypothetical protein